MLAENITEMSPQQGGDFKPKPVADYALLPDDVAATKADLLYVVDVSDSPTKNATFNEGALHVVQNCEFGHA